MSGIERRPTNRALAQSDGPAFNLLALLPGRASSIHTQRAYYRWIDHFLVTVAGLKPTAGDARFRRMGALPVDTLQKCLSAPQLRAWLGILATDGHGRQGLNQARAAIITLSNLLAESGWLDDYTSAAMSNVRLPNAEDGQRPGRWLSLEQIRRLMAAAGDIGTSQNQIVRNRLVITMLCTMALRREEVAAIRWQDLGMQNDRIVLRVHGKGRKMGLIDIPRPVIGALEAWRRCIAVTEPRPLQNSALVRRLWKGGRISRMGLTSDGIWLIVNDAANAADLGHVAPHDLRRSVAGALQEAGVPIEKISRLLRHSNVAVTERYLSRLPQRNEGAVMMSDLLDLDDVEWPGL